MVEEVSRFYTGSFLFFQYGYNYLVLTPYVAIGHSSGVTYLARLLSTQGNFAHRLITYIAQPFPLVCLDGNMHGLGYLKTK